MILLIDLDNTIYPASCGLLRAIDRRMSQFMTEKLGFDSAEVDTVRVEYWKKYGTTLRGLRETTGVDELDFLSFVHELDLENHIKPDGELRKTLEALPHTKYIYTNADRSHADRVLEAMGLTGLFAEIFDITALGMIGKPDPLSYELIEKKLALLDGNLFGKTASGDSGDPEEKIVFFDDYAKYLEPAKQRGWITVHVEEESGDGVIQGGEELCVDFTISKIHFAPHVLDLIERNTAGAI